MGIIDEVLVAHTFLEEQEHLVESPGGGDEVRQVKVEDY